MSTPADGIEVLMTFRMGQVKVAIVAVNKLVPQKNPWGLTSQPPPMAVATESGGAF